MAKRQSFADKSSKKAHVKVCPVCNEEMQLIKFVRSIKSETGSWKFRSLNTGVCKCNQKEVYG